MDTVLGAVAGGYFGLAVFVFFMGEAPTFNRAVAQAVFWPVFLWRELFK